MKCGTKILSNKIRCKLCGDIIESKTTHDFQVCKCWKESDGYQGCAVDGGHSYCRRLGNPENIEDLSEWRPLTNEEVDAYNEQKMLLAEQYPGMYRANDLMEYYEGASVGNDDR